MSDIAIKVSGLGKLYHIGKRERYKTFREAAMEVLASSLRCFAKRERAAAQDSFWALQDVSFEVGHGEVIGVIGRNGTGMSALLKILSRITDPTLGSAELTGRVGSLLEVGTDFHPELTGKCRIGEPGH